MGNWICKLREIVGLYHGYDQLSSCRRNQFGQSSEHTSHESGRQNPHSRKCAQDGTVEDLTVDDQKQVQPTPLRRMYDNTFETTFLGRRSAQLSWHANR